MMERFYDPDIEDGDEALSVVDHYEWTLTDDSFAGSIMQQWQRIKTLNVVNNTHVCITVSRPLHIFSLKMFSICVFLCSCTANVLLCYMSHVHDNSFNTKCDIIYTLHRRSGNISLFNK